MKLMTYNIRDGAVETLGEVIEIINSESPDFLTLNEANTFAKDNNKILKEFASATGFEFFDIALSGQGDYHVAIFSKYPVKELRKLKGFTRACIVALVDSPLGLISIAGAHLAPYSEDLRIPEINSILNFQKKYDLRILMGDLNSLSKGDSYDPSIISNFNEIQQKKFTTGKELRFSVIEKVMSSGYLDSAINQKQNSENTVPTLGNEDISHTKLRLDYIFISGALSSCIKKYSVLKNILTEKASDHYPVIVELSK